LAPRPPKIWTFRTYRLLWALVGSTCCSNLEMGKRKEYLGKDDEKERGRKGKKEIE